MRTTRKQCHHPYLLGLIDETTKRNRLVMRLLIAFTLSIGEEGFRIAPRI
jgi:hypothetical protein